MMGTEPAEIVEEAQILSVENRYPALYTISTLLRFMGWVVIVGGILLSVIAGLVVGSTGDGDSGVFGFLVAIVGSFASIVQGIVVLALADLVLLFIDIERNTRVSALNSDEID